MNFTFTDSEIAGYIKEHVICGLCRELVYSSVGCNNCATLIWGDCIDNILSHQALNGRAVIEQCPFCKSQLGFVKNVFVDKMLVNFSLDCEDCTETFTYLDYQPHLTECPEALFACELCGKIEKRADHICVLMRCEWCNAKVEKTSIDFHLGEQCPDIPVECLYCDTTMKRKEIVVHHRIDCVDYPVTCEYCKDVMPRCIFLNHYSTCDEYIRSCQFCCIRYKNKEVHECIYELCSECNEKIIIDLKIKHEETCPAYYCKVCKQLFEDLRSHKVMHQPDLIDLGDNNQSGSTGNIMPRGHSLHSGPESEGPVSQ